MQWCVESLKRLFCATISDYIHFLSALISVQRATYDSDGNIILEGGKPSQRTSAQAASEPQIILQETRTATWTVIPDMPAPATAASVEVSRALPAAKKQSVLLASVVHESSRQYAATARSTQAGLSELSDVFASMPSRMQGSLRKFWKTARTPVQIPGLRSGRKPPTKLTLFVTDTIRFGGTFALIFGALFVTVNYQSFFQIARAQLALGTDIKTEEALQNIASGTDLAGGLRGTIGTTSEVNILKYLPAVGPYEDRLIIPKIGKNIPIVRPSMEALVKEDWKQFEVDIQTALRDGVIHYPGSARPGQAGNFFVTGHSSYYPWDEGRYKDVFARLSELEPGDTYFVYYGGDRHTYRVTRKFEVKPTDVTVLDQPSDRRVATLMTCTPVGTTLRRLIVQAEEIDPATGELLKVGEKTDETATKPFIRLEALPI